LLLEIIASHRCSYTRQFSLFPLALAIFFLHEQKKSAICSKEGTIPLTPESMKSSQVQEGCWIGGRGGAGG
jgi:hypothetical protein